MGLTFRRAELADADAIATIWYDGWRDGHLGNLPDDLVEVRLAEDWTARAQRRVGESATSTVVAVIDEIVGFVMVLDDEVEQVYVAASHRGTGVAKDLLAEAERLVAANGQHRAWLAVAPGNTRARRFYERQGWSDDGLLDYRSKTAHGEIPTPVRRYVKQVG